jgi:hypothetical protein
MMFGTLPDIMLHDLKEQSLLGTGGYGEVMKSTHLPSGVTVAIKKPR